MKICVVLVDRANYGRLMPLMDAIAQSDHELCIASGGTMNLARFKEPGVSVGNRFEGCEVVLVDCEMEGSIPRTQAKSIGLAVGGYADAFERVNPDAVMIIGDRYEAVGAALAAATMKLTLIHLQGGEISGSLDERYRHAITKLADYHVPATQKAKQRILQMGERDDSILTVGCPGSDVAARCKALTSSDLLVVYHPDTDGRTDVKILAEAVKELGVPALWLWPNIDAGSDELMRELREYRTRHNMAHVSFTTNLEPEVYLSTLAGVRCALGNSSSFVRDSGYFGTPVVLVGDRQSGRERGLNVFDVDLNVANIVKMVRGQMEYGRREPCDLYGDGQVSQRVIASLSGLQRRKKVFQCQQQPDNTSQRKPADAQLPKGATIGHGANSVIGS